MSDSVPLPTNIRSQAFTLLRTSAPGELNSLAGTNLHHTQFLVIICSRLAPFALWISIALVVWHLKFWALIFAPAFLLGYFVSSMSSLRGGSMIWPTVLFLGNLVLPLLPNIPTLSTQLLFPYTLALFLNRYAYWRAERVVRKYPDLQVRILTPLQGNPVATPLN